MSISFKDIPFRVQSHVLKLLGDELIGHDRLAVFELVKNSYDADARQVTVTLQLSGVSPHIVVEDNGDGMALSTIENAWLEVGTDSKRGSAKKQRTKLGRLPLGEKGVGRLAVQKLGKSLKLITRQLHGIEYEFLIDWDGLIQSARYLGSGLQVRVTARNDPLVFKGEDAKGTRIEIFDLHRSEWSRRDIRDLYRLVTSLSNPFKSVDAFQVELNLPGREDEIDDLPSLKDMIESAVWRYDFLIDGDGKFTWEYRFTPPKFKGLKSRSNQGIDDKLQLIEADDDDLPLEVGQSRPRRDDRIFLAADHLKGIGPVGGVFYAFYRRDEILKASGAPTQMKKWLDNQTGVRVYRDGIRVFNYGEPDDDWLGLNVKRINRPAGKLGVQSVIAQIEIEQATSSELREKTNREGFDKNERFRMFRRLSQSIFDHFHREHGFDRGEIDRALKGEDAPPPAVEVALEKLEELGRKHKIEKEIKPVLRSIQQELNTFRDAMVSSGLAGMNLALVFHEVAHSIDRMQRKLKGKVEPEDIHREIDHLKKLLETFKPLLQRDPPRKVTMQDLVGRASGMHEDRFQRHEIVFSNWTADAEKRNDFIQLLPRGLMVGALSNAIDNAIYWTRFRKERDQRTEPGAILILSHWDDEEGGFLVVVDNGPGFQLSKEQFARPFQSTRAGGMGLGLFYCKTVMDSIGGTLSVMDVADLRDLVDVPMVYDGTAVVFSFRNEK